MSAQRKTRSPSPRSSHPPQDPPAQRAGSPTADLRGTQPEEPGSHWNQRQDPERPERSADGGAAEMRGNSGSPEAQSGDPHAPDQPESADRGRRPHRRGES